MAPQKCLVYRELDASELPRIPLNAWSLVRGYGTMTTNPAQELE
jgi:hypothetical protein